MIPITSSLWTFFLLLGLLLTRAVCAELTYEDDYEIIARAEAYLDAMNRRDVALASGLSKRSFTNSANYTPTRTPCPSGSLVRLASAGLSSDESQYVDERNNMTRDALVSLLDRIGLDDFDASDFLGSNTSIKIGLAISGGGYRAMLSGAGFLAAADNRTVNATDSGHIGGLLQASTYLVGLSGGSWLVGSMVMNNFSSVQDLQTDPVLWDLSNSLLSPKGVNITAADEFYAQVVDEIAGKADAGFETSLTDIWGRLLSQQMFNYSGGGPGLVWSDIADTGPFASRELPFPMVTVVGVTEGEVVDIETTTAFEFSPYEMGSWDNTVGAFFLTKYLGSEAVNGTPANSNECVVGFDNAGFVIGTSSSLFNLSPLNSSLVLNTFLPSQLMSALGETGNDSYTQGVAVFAPNPFFGVDDANMRLDPLIGLADGGEDGQNVPLLPLLQPEREVDVIFALDNSANLESGWPNGEALITTYERQYIRESAALPYVPDNNSFVALNLTRQPTFFGCDASNMSTITPLIVYMANYPYSYLTNTSTLKLTYTTEEIEGFITNGYNLGTQGNGTIDSEWPACMACALIHREVERRGIEHTAQCQQCMQNHCWDGSIATANATFEQIYPDLLINANTSSTAAVSSSTTTSTASATTTSTASATTVIDAASESASTSVALSASSSSLSLSSSASESASSTPSATSTNAAGGVAVPVWTGAGCAVAIALFDNFFYYFL
ncbi:lysophospholipase catalytic domain-containing protein [Lipomyces orientalis]|uniref:Lysophospholipase catalytic domain-containing protein n=1 Tax=Lipomyces orientalis TaxID=1233043 RepID=A0ACC3TVL8_9ASCO